MAIVLVFYVLGSWVRLLAAGSETIENKDWVNFYRAGWLFRRDELTRLYAEVVGSQQPFVHPPYFVWLCAPLALWTSPWPPYLLCVASAFAGAAVAVIVSTAARLRAVARHHALTAALVLVASAPWLGCVMTGQLSGLWLALLVGSLAAWRAGRPLLAGLLLAGLAMKPNLLLPIAMLPVVGRHPRVLAGLALGVAGLVATTLPLGVALWSDYRAASARVAGLAFDGTLAPWMHQTLLAFWTWATGLARRPDLAWLPWIATALVATALVVRTWWTVREPAHAPRLLGEAALFAVAVNPYLFFYDGLLLAVPALVWFLERESFASPARWRACGMCVLAVFAWQHVAMFTHYVRCPPLVGPLCLLWLGFDTLDLSSARLPSRRSRTGAGG